MKFNSIFVCGEKVFFTTNKVGKYIDMKHPVTESSCKRINKLVKEHKIESRLLSFGTVVFRRP